MPQLEESNLTGLALAYALVEADGAPILGCPEGPFAFLHPDGKTLGLVSDNMKDVQVWKMAGIDSCALDWAQKREASFTVKNNEVTCAMGHIAETGKSYPEAASRAVLAWLREGQ